MLQWEAAPTMAWHAVELFSGAGNVSAAFREAGRDVASFDKLHGKEMDITLNAGFAFGTQL